MNLPLRQYFFNHVAQTSKFPLAFQISKAEGLFLYDEKGIPYLDCISGISVSNVGHKNPKVIQAIKNQADNYLHTMVYGEHIQSPQVLLAQKLSSLTNNKLDSVYFVNSGAEAVEGSIKLARRFTGRKEIIACRNAYHGSTIGAMSLMSDEKYKNAYGPFLQDVQFIRFNDISTLNTITSKTAGVIIEIVQGEAGYIPIEKNFLIALKNRCYETGALLIFDEIQTGMGRTGKMFAHEHYQIIPDILLLAKALGGGLPLGAFMAPKKIMSVLTHNPPLGHMTTFGGNPLACAASLAAIEVIEEEHLLENVIKLENYLKENLHHHVIREVRGMGFMIAVQLDTFERVQKLIKYAHSKQILLDWFLFNDTAIRIAPPLIMTEDQMKRVCITIIDFLSS